MGIFYFILICWGLKLVKLKKCFFLPTSNKFAIQNNTLMQLRLIFYKTLIKTIWKSDNFKIIDLVTFQQLRRLWKGGGHKFVLFLSLLLSVHKKSSIWIKFSYKSFYCNFLFIFLYCFLHFVGSAISLFFIFLIFLYKYNKYM